MHALILMIFCSARQTPSIIGLDQHLLLQAKGMTYNKGSYVSGDTEEEAADELRMAVHDALCRDQDRAKIFQEVDYSVEKFDGGKAK